MKITEQQLAYAAKALGVDKLRMSYEYQDGAILPVIDGKGVFETLAPGFAEWAVPVLEERFATVKSDIPLDNGQTSDSMSVSLYREQHAPTIESGKEWCAEVRWYKDGCGLCNGMEANGPDIDTAVFLLAAKIGEGME